MPNKNGYHPTQQDRAAIYAKLLSTLSLALSIGFGFASQLSIAADNTQPAESSTFVEPIDPLASPMWTYQRKRFLGDADYQFDKRIVVSVPDYAENPTQVPIQIDASALQQPIEKILIWGDLNPIVPIMTIYPTENIEPMVAVNIKVQQASPIRAAVLTKDGKWLLGGVWLDAAGGGCTTASVGNADPYWQSHLGEAKSRFFSDPIHNQSTISENSGRYKFTIVHPMDTGLIDGIPEFYIEDMTISGMNDQPLMRLELYQPVSENPTFSFNIPDASAFGGLKLSLRDNNGNEFEHQQEISL